MKTRFGEYGGQYVPEVLMNEVNKVAEAFEECKKTGNSRTNSTASS